MTLIEEIKSIFKNRPKHKNKEQKKAEKDATYDDKKEMKHAAKISLYPRINGYRFALIIMLLIAVAFLSMMIIVDALPTDLTMIIIVIMLVMLVLCSMLFASRLRRKRVFGILIALIYAALFSSIIGFMGNTYALLNKISDGGEGVTSKGPAPKEVNITEEPFNIYITGIDQWAKEKGLDLERSDVNMLVTVNPTTKKVLLTSIPRDTYVELYTAKQMDKLTHTGIYGVDETLNTVEKWLGIELNYYAKMNFTGARDIIDAMGGIDVYSPVEFKSSLKGYRYYKGWNHLRGKKAIYFARERKAFEGQDAIRVENQQRVLKAMIKKMTSSITLLTRYGAIMDAAGDNMQTNLSTDEMKELVKMQITELATWDVQTQKIEGEYGEDYVASLTQAQKFSVYRPDEESVKSCVNGIKSIMNPSAKEIEELEKNRTRSFFNNAVRRLLRKDVKNDEGAEEEN